ncbi:sigma-54-dependent Fis family transcriptional regulator [Thalassotalea insulae]|uniref:Sigma-54-dependent Fis family transcriptional regulator n=1 Tax=Thalassotalea insulae TaxID=2056778 RepID=A0ABQ6GTA8_9GAMM|nr:sigma-54 dependent transcriptional regulator [Thalassotalea insulae]GLX78559.1 sigma-54-dependent Fis family transcriptional regulator [Thalassotalea insulae]
MTNILVIDDRSDIRLSLVLLLEDHGYQVIEADNPQTAQQQLKQHTISLILLDMNFSLDTTSGEEGLQFLNWLQSAKLNTPVIAMTAWSNTDLVVQAMKLGAKDFIEKPWKNKQLIHIISQQLSLTSLQQENAKFKQQLTEQAIQHYQWQSACMAELLDTLKKVAATDANILLTGANGTGKSELARFVHQHSNRQHHPLISVNMGSIPENLFESEMFGHVKGAFTDAKANRIGRFELAENGSLFLDEIANIPLTQQAKLLRVLESGEYEVLGSSKTQRANCRVISATNGKFSELIANDVFREDLYYRLNTIELTVPSLQERSLDIIPLAKFFITQFSQKYHSNYCELTQGAQQALLEYHWPGNIRELSHLIERAVLLNSNALIDVEDLRLKAAAPKQQLPIMTLRDAEIQLIKKALLQTDNHIPQAAKLLGLTKSSMYRRIEKYELA